MLNMFVSANSMSIDVYRVDDDKKVIYPLCVSSTLVTDRHGIHHYTIIRNFSRLVGSQISNHEHGVYCCKQCLHVYSTQELLNAHAAVRRKGPSFLRILKPVDEDGDTTQGVEVGGESSSHVFQEHITCSFAYKVVSSVDPNFSRPLVMYRGEDADEKFVRDLQQEAKQFQNQCYVLLQNYGRLTTPVIYAKNYLEIIVTV